MLDISRLVDYAIPIIKQEDLQRYEKQIAESKGFDVDYFYGIEFRTGLIAPVACRQCYTEDLLDAIDEQNKIRQAEGRPSISLVRVLKLNSQIFPPHLYFTFVAKDVPDGTERTYQAKLYTGEKLITKIFREKPPYGVIGFMLPSGEWVNYNFTDPSNPSDLQRYEKQVKESDGFDVDYFPGIEMTSTLIAPIACREIHVAYLLDAIKVQNVFSQSEGRPSISLVRVLKLNSQIQPPILSFTFVAKVVPDGTERTYQAKLYTGEKLYTIIFREKSSPVVQGCSNNNYASREKRRKCGQSKEEAAMPAIAISGAHFPTYEHYTYEHYSAMMHDRLGLKMNYGITGNSTVHQSLPPNPNWSFAAADKYGYQTWPLAGSSDGAFSYTGNTNQHPAVLNGWRHGDWICNCGFHNYSSRSQCKECNAPLSSGLWSSTTRSTAPDLFPTLGTKRLTSEEFVNERDNKRLHARDIGCHFLHQTHGPHPYQISEQPGRSSYDQARGLYSRNPSGNTATSPPLHATLQPAQFTRIHPLLGKRAKQWRDGDWMCNNCNNHNFASRSCCNRCQSQKETDVL